MRKDLLVKRFPEGQPPQEDAFSNFIESNMCLTGNVTTHDLSTLPLLVCSSLSTNDLSSTGNMVMDGSTYQTRSVTPTARASYKRFGIIPVDGSSYGVNNRVLLVTASPTSAQFNVLNGISYVYHNDSNVNKFLAPSDASYKIDNLSSGASFTLAAQTTKEFIVFSSAKLVKSI
jgi:hypothetical protein